MSTLTNSWPRNKKKSFPHEDCILTIHLMNGASREFRFFENSAFESWHLSPIVVSPKDTLTIKYANGERIHFPLCNIESYHVSPRNRIDKVEAFKRELLNEPVKEEEDAEIPPTVHNG
jgi:hypothetical protein